jgi:diguanylate cyclase (GGDEF)-like protein/PAS domain S-box-containing protein
VRGNIFDLVLLSVLILFFGVLQARRPQRSYRLWLLAWLMVMASLLVWMLPIQNAALLVAQECVRIDLVLCGGVLFLLSFANTQENSVREVTWYTVLLAVSPILLNNLIDAHLAPRLLFIGLILIGEAAAIWVAELTIVRKNVARLAQLQCVIITPALLFSVWTNQSNFVLAITLIQIYSACALLILGMPNKRDTGRWTCALGFLAWSFAYVAYEMTWEHAVLATLVTTLWNVPKFLVGFGMILMVLEDDTAQIKTLSEEYRLLYKGHPNPMWIFDPATARFLSVNDAAVKAYGYSRQEFLEMTLFDIRPNKEHAKLKNELTTSVWSDNLVWRHRRKNGELFDVDISGHDVFFQGTPARFVLAMDITEREKLNRQLVYNAQHDSLTGLANRMLLEDRAQQTVARSVRDGNKVAILTIDVDRFKQINDTYGHLIGDECLKEIAIRLGSRVRDADTLARTGGEEFTVMVGGLTSKRGAMAAASSLLNSLIPPLKLTANEISISISVGIAVYPDDGADLDTIRKRSDKALYEAKRMGGGRAVQASEEQEAEQQSAIDLEAALREALHRKTLEIAYQPIFDAAGRLARVEALVRGTDECLRNASPAAFIPIAEECGLILPLGAWVLEESCRQLAEWNEKKLPRFELSVNVSARQLVQENFAEQVLEVLDRYHLAPELLHLELTETTLMRDFTSMVRSMKLLSEAGVLFSIDDFGTGYSSLARLSDLPISTLKIDRSFIIKLTQGEAAVGIVHAIVHMSRHLSLEIVAEGVELPEHIEILLDLGCHMFQGFYLSRPLSPLALETAISEDALGFKLNPVRSLMQTDAVDRMISDIEAENPARVSPPAQA